MDEGLNIKQLLCLSDQPWLKPLANATGKKIKHMQAIEKVLSVRNLTEACSEFVKNKGASGVDDMSVKELKAYLDINREALVNQIHQGDYIPSPIRGKEIPKRNGKKRLLGIPTAIDRMLQQAVSRVIMPQYEYMFSEYSYGFIHKIFL